MIDSEFWRGRRVLVTGHTGFKGAWLSHCLIRLGAKVSGLSLPPETEQALFCKTKLDKRMVSVFGDIRDFARLSAVIREAAPEIVIHMAAQSLVGKGYEDPIGTYATNVLGTAHLLEAARHGGTVRVILNVTSDKCYENMDWPRPYRETDALGGSDPYSSSKACAELLTAAWRRSFFRAREGTGAGIAVATARAGNVIGGGDWAPNRLVPDCIRALREGKRIVLRNPRAVRPWQHVLEPLLGYMILCQRLWSDGPAFAESWNFGPDAASAPKQVGDLVAMIAARWGADIGWVEPGVAAFAESRYLTIDSSKAHERLRWRPKLPIAQAVEWTVAWYRRDFDGGDVVSQIEDQIDEYLATRKLRQEYVAAAR